ncbi:DUF6942 family protein [Neptunomonas antarctica]|uniref:Uncharacterized protein n=1 Tax=Neptunomonas antarctica TaxID=619304 RepID=A0A1N7J2F5_9GAMM|nr:hypothetical protein [Neptunomonas antarctica]SIS43426.1 hypothetical protein SAMN05421760_101499 [Neptunomonas antarctica]
MYANTSQKNRVTNDCEFNYLGAVTADIILYTENRPMLPADILYGERLMIPDLIALNGNHWRKIFTIFAKLVSPSDDWRGYRDGFLLQEKEAIYFGDALHEMLHETRNETGDVIGNTTVKIHLISGKSTWDRLGVNLEEFQPLDPQQRLWVKDNMICMPYLDYRQFPNSLIEIARNYLIKATL